MRQKLRTALLVAFCATILAIGGRSAVAQTVEVNDIVRDFDGGQLVIPSVRVEGSSLDAAAVEALFAGTDIAELAKRWSAVDAKAITIDEIRVVMAAGKPEASTTVYRDIRLDEVADGVAAALVIGASSSTSGPQGETPLVEVALKAMRAASVDVGVLVGFYVGSGRDEPLRTAFRDLVVDGGSMRVADVLTCEVGAVTIAEYRLRPLRTDLAALMAMTAEMQAHPDREPTPEQLRQIIAFLPDLVTAVETSAMRVDGVGCTSKDPESTQTVTFRVDRVDAAPFGGTRLPAVTYSGLAVNLGAPVSASLQIGSFTFKGADLSGTLQALETMPADDPTWLEANARRLVPLFEGLSMADMSYDAQDPGRPDRRLTGGVGLFDVTLARHMLGIPIDIAVTARNVRFGVPDDPANENAKLLRALGYDRFDAGFSLSLAWDEPTSTIALRSLAVDEAAMGSLSLTGLFGNALPTLFDANPAIQQGAAMAVTVKELDLDVVDRGLKDRLLAFFAQQNGMAPEAFQAQFAGMVQAVLPQMLGGAAESAVVADAVGKFVSNGTKLMVRLAAKNDAGIGMVDFMATGDNPAMLLDQIEIKASAE